MRARERVRIVVVAAFLAACAACGGGGSGPAGGDAAGDGAAVENGPGDDGAEAGPDGGDPSPAEIEVGPDGSDPGDPDDAVPPDAEPDGSNPPESAPDADEGGGGDVPEDDATPDAGADDPGDDPGGDATPEADEGAEADAGCDGPACLPPCPDDGLECTAEVRDPATHECVPFVLPGYCLIGGVCRFNLEPDPDHPCLFCDPGQSLDSFSPHAGLPCDDGEPCTEGDSCDAAGACDPGAPADCNDGNACTNDKCVNGKGCEHTANKNACDDGQGVCTYQKQCSGGKCIGKKIPCTDADPCTAEACDPVKGCVFPIAIGAPCSDAMPCTTGDACGADGKCRGTAVVCDDGNQCTADSCNPTTGQCMHQPTFGGCDDGNACTTNDHCEAGAKCVGYDLLCEDGNPCTDDSCEPGTGCTFRPNWDTCDDGDPCTEDDVCGEGRCDGAERNCADSNLCTIDTCDPVAGCLHAINWGPCEDGNLCTSGETCSTGFCAGGVNVDCDDGETCTYDKCDPAVGCVHEPVIEPCDDMDPCTQDDFCSGGQCAGTTIDCDDGVACTIDTCGAGGTCTHAIVPDGGACEDGNKCLADRKCQGAVCVGKSLDCDDGSPCTTDKCFPETGCRHEPKSVGNCNDGSACTLGDRCVAGECVGTSLPCSDGNACTDDTCDESGGCVFPHNSAPCDDKDPCTGPDTCSGGGCTSRSLFTDPVAKTALLSYGTSGNPGQGLNVDNNGSTCAPKGTCAQGIDNAFAKLAWLFNPELTRAVAEGSAGIVIEPEAGPAGVALNLFWARVVAPPGCDPAGAGCTYRVYASDVVDECSPKYRFDNAILDGTHLTAGGKAYDAPFYVVIGALRLPVTLHWAALDASVSVSNGTFVSGSGVLAGALYRQELIDAVSGAPADAFPPPYTRDVLVQYLTKYVVPDLDVSGDGMKDAISVGMPFTLVTGKVAGFQ
ncbi:MAG: hypothetical protein FJ087_00165 [Deltaproteobacteria bacterium]|nr:hypothetical protein [Deltaproteobacteria bacterium]